MLANATFVVQETANLPTASVEQSLGSFEIPQQPEESDITVEERCPESVANTGVGGTARGKDLLVDNRGFQYTLKKNKQRPNGYV